MRRGSRSVDDELQLAVLNVQRRASRASVNAQASGSTGGGVGSLGVNQGVKPSSEPDIRGVAMAQAMAQAQAQAQARAANADGTSIYRQGGPASSTANVSDSPYQGNASAGTQLGARPTSKAK